MAKNESVKSAGAGGDEASDGAVSWREQAVARSLDSARTRAENRVQRFLDAALELMNDGDTSDFTVQEVVERSGQSLRSFYQYFGGKHELLLALFEESIRAGVEEVAEKIAQEPDETARLRRFVIDYYLRCRPGPKSKRRGTTTHDPVIIEFAQQLLTEHPAEASRAFAPLVDLFEEVLNDAAEAGAIRSGLATRSVAGTVLEVVMFNAFSSTIGGMPIKQDATDAAEELWDLLLNGLVAR
ncbi:MAG: TetR/AcrR family transcriptional regulator [Acidimicrobiales bacterium]|nr:TetR/AcrR family transcriptional regulator [Acidimicrobiales bacterium]